MIIRREGNLFDYVHQAYAHGVSNKGKMGAGIAIDFKKNYPFMFKEYKNLCKKNILKPGEVFFYNKQQDLPFVFNLISQDNLFNSDYIFLKKSIENMYVVATNNDIKDIGMPEIGCGLGKLRLEDLISALRPFSNSSDLNVTIYSLGSPSF